MIQVDDLTISYKGRTVLKDVSFEAPACTITAFIGPSGSGKSSLLAVLNRLCDLIPGCSASGKAQIGGVNIMAPDTDVLNLRRRVGMVFQRPNPFPLSILKNITMPLKQHGVHDKQHIQSIVQRSLRDVGLWEEVKDRLNAPALALSGGQQQRLCLARALALDPEVILCDEPCSALDPFSTSLIEELLQALSRRLTVVIVTHNLAQAKRIADKTAVFWLKDSVGTIIEVGNTEQLFSDPKSAETAAYISGRRG